jgi:ABC-type transporter Mla MlaB component
MSDNSAHSAETTLSFDGVLTLANANDVRTSLIAALQAHDLLVLDCSGLREVDLSFIQCVLAARRSAADQGKSVMLAAPAEGSLREALLRGGFLSAPGTQAHPDEAFWTREGAV